MIASLNRLTSVTPTPAEVAVAREAARQLKKVRGKKSRQSELHLTSRNTTSPPIPLPSSVMRLVLRVLQEMADGKSLALVPCDREITTEQAAQILNVSRPFVAKLVDEGKLPARKVGRNRRIRLDDLLAFKKRDDKVREKALADLAALSQELEMGY